MQICCQNVKCRIGLKILKFNTQKGHATKNVACPFGIYIIPINDHFCVVFGRRTDGGDEENRTPVRKYCCIDFSERSLWLDLRNRPSTNKRLHSDLDKSSRQRLRELALRYPAVSPLSVFAGEKQTGVSLKRLKRNLR